ncbi:hypothetical protein RB653_000529 [Dictyostelium firmibasis]|uniref:Uncharacterized protein n=1 Tax=Dictyostelium firmibasis TaxID=79012 RepID=A0AAN7TV93_9MYCE
MNQVLPNEVQSVTFKLQSVDDENEYSSIRSSSSMSLYPNFINGGSNENLSMLYYNHGQQQQQQQLQQQQQQQQHLQQQQQQQQQSNQIQLQQIQLSKNEPIILNIGGFKYCTTKGTLTNQKNNYFDILFSGNYNVNVIKTPNKPDTYFIDRDGTHFRIILNFLRGDCSNIPECEQIRNELYVEADFFCLSGLKEILYPYHFFQSKILSVELSKDLIKLLKSKLHIKKSRLLYRGSDNNFSSKKFHELCDFKGSTITVIRSKDNIFGGFTSKHWTLSTQYTQDNQSFLFDLANIPPSIIKKEENSSSQSIYSNINYGPTFGILGKNLTISNNCNSNKENFFESYYDIKGKGKRYFQVDEYEVFKIEC